MLVLVLQKHQHLYESSSQLLEDSPMTSTWVYWEEQLDSSFDFRLFEAPQPVAPFGGYG
jgi:hypothetical protein